MRDCSWALVLGLSFSVPSRALLAPAMPTSRGQTSIRTRATAVTSMVYDVVKYTPNRWAGEEVEAGFGGVWPGDPNAKTHRVTVVDKAGEEVAAMDVPVDRYIYFAFEEADIDVQIHNQKRMCRNGCCTVCATKVKEGKVKMEGALGLLKELKRDGYALTCCSYPRSDLTLQLQDEDEVNESAQVKVEIGWGDASNSSPLTPYKS